MVKGKINRKSQKFNITFFSATFEKSTKLMTENKQGRILMVNDRINQGNDGKKYQ